MIIGNSNPGSFIESRYNSVNDYLFLPINFLYTHVIHELIHMLTRHILSKSPLVISVGLSISNERVPGRITTVHQYLNEVITEQMTREIETILMKKINFTSQTNSYDNFFPLTQNFYMAFKDQLKYHGINGGMDNFIFELGEEFTEYEQTFHLLVWEQLRRLQKDSKSIEFTDFMKETMNSLTQKLITKDQDRKLKTNQILD